MQRYALAFVHRGFVVTCFERLCFGLLWRLTGALPAGERMVIMAYITLFSIPLSQGVALSWSLSQSTIQTLLFSRVSVTATAS